MLGFNPLSERPISDIANALVSRLIDNFDDNSRDTALWNEEAATGTPSETGGTLSITPLGAGYGYSGYKSVNKFDVTGSSIYVKVASAANPVAGAETYLALNIDGTAEISMLAGNSSIIPRYRIGSTNSDTYPTYNAVTHLWWKISESAGSIYYDTSSDGTTWTNLRTQAHTYTSNQLQNVNVWLIAGQYQALTPTNAGGTTVFDNFNVAPSAPATNSNNFFLMF